MDLSIIKKTILDDKLSIQHTINHQPSTRTRGMVLEVAILNIKEGLSKEFEQSIAHASSIIVSIKGYLSHQLKKCIEIESQYILLVNWETLEDHEIGFRNSPEYQNWKKLLHHFYEPFPEVFHYE